MLKNKCYQKEEGILHTKDNEFEFEFNKEYFIVDYEGEIIYVLNYLYEERENN